MNDAIVFLGIQGSGKGTQAKLLADLTGFQHINMGDLFRDQIRKKTELGLEVQAVITRGDLVDDELVFKLVSSSLGDDCRGIIFDGFPRTLAQAEYLIGHYKIRRVYYLDLSEADAIARIEARRMCGSCGENYNLISKNPKKAGICDVCGGELKQRADDSSDAIRQRVSEFYAQTFALKEFFAGKGLLKQIPADMAIDELHSAIVKDLGI